jgi:hypothetical protein
MLKNEKLYEKIKSIVNAKDLENIYKKMKERQDTSQDETEQKIVKEPPIISKKEELCPFVDYSHEPELIQILCDSRNSDLWERYMNEIKRLAITLFSFVQIYIMINFRTYRKTDSSCVKDISKVLIPEEPIQDEFIMNFFIEYIKNIILDDPIVYNEDILLKDIDGIPRIIGKEENDIVKRWRQSDAESKLKESKLKEARMI